MPELARFFGIVITVFFGDHDPPHIHASHGERGHRFRASEWAAQIVIDDGRVLGGDAPARDLKLIRKWIKLHREALHEAWLDAKAGKTPKKIPPLGIR